MNFINPTAIIEEGTNIGQGNHFGEGVIIRSNVSIGNNNYFGAYTIIGDKGGFKSRKGQEPKGKIIIGDNNVFKSHVVVKSPEYAATTIMDDNLIMDFVNIGHDSIVGKQNIISTGARLAGHTDIGDRNNIGMNACIHQRQRIPNGCMLGMGSVIPPKLVLESGNKYAGNPAKYIKPNK